MTQRALLPEQFSARLRDLEAAYLGYPIPTSGPAFTVVWLAGHESGESCRNAWARSLCRLAQQ